MNQPGDYDDQYKKEIGENEGSSTHSIISKVRGDQIVLKFNPTHTVRAFLEIELFLKLLTLHAHFEFLIKKVVNKKEKNRFVEIVDVCSGYFVYVCFFL